VEEARKSLEMYSVTERVENEGENHSEDLGVDGRIILE
jgi:hypothetical protein